MTRRVPMDRLIDFGVAFMTKRGVPRENAFYVSRVAVESEAFLQNTHGLAQFVAVDAALGRTVDPGAEPKVTVSRATAVTVDGSRCLGSLALKKAREEAVRLARQHGSCFAAVRNTQWVGALGMHLLPVAREGMLCQAWAQNSSCRDCAPFGGIDPRFSTNPVAIVLPGEENPVLADFSTATMSFAAAKNLARRGKTTDAPRFLDEAGRPSDDPAVLERGGTMMFAGGDTEGYKGYALSLFNEALAALAGGSANNPEVPLLQSAALLVLDPEAFSGADRYRREMRRFLAHVRSSRPRPGFGRVRLPGERGFAALADCRARGVPLGEEKLSLLGEIAERNDIKPID